jgi:hypothetical protein
MNQWGAVKLGLTVAAVGMFGALKFSHGAATTQPQESRSYGLMKLASMDSVGMISGAAGSLGEAEGGSGFSARGASSLQSNAAPSAAARAPGAPTAQIRKIVRTASVLFEVTDQNKARSLVRAAAFRNGGEIESDQSSGAGDNQSGVIVIKAAPERLDAILKELEPVGRVLERTVSSANMSEEYVDLKARLDNARKVEKRLSELLSFQTHRLSDVLEVERELERVGRDIETTIGRIKYIDSLAANSCVTVRLQQPLHEASQAPGVLTNIRNSVVGAFNTFLSTGLALLSMTGFLLAIGLWTVPVAGVAWLAKKKIWG